MQFVLRTSGQVLDMTSKPLPQRLAFMEPVGAIQAASEGKEIIVLLSYTIYDKQRWPAWCDYPKSTEVAHIPWW